MICKDPLWRVKYRSPSVISGVSSLALEKKDFTPLLECRTYPTAEMQTIVCQLRCHFATVSAWVLSIWLRSDLSKLNHVFLIVISGGRFIFDTVYDLHYIALFWHNLFFLSKKIELKLQVLNDSSRFELQHNPKQSKTWLWLLIRFKWNIM